ncbi:MAG TPA: xanthine dehydrogenase family protein molybdopterin-binding subunit [Methylomirabilota bacterium]|jgi:carbon-monoxide dehydrogenase large subunit|nr:xanthine dehydrogenase family protein molybdopterin-binding subunit [Methylomirabilota bacterium]
MSQAASSGWVGRPLRRREDAPLLVGAGRYVDDLAPPGLTHLALLRCPHASADVVEIQTRRARTAPGVVAVITGADLGEIGALPVNRQFRDMIVPPNPLLAGARVHAQGTPVAAVVAETAAAAWDAVALIDVTWRARAGVALPRPALAAGAPTIFDEAPGNRGLGQTWRAGDPDAAFAGAAHVVELTVQQNLLAGVPMETRGALAAWDEITGALTLWTSTQAPFRIRSEVARMLELDEAHVRVIAPDVGGGFGVKGGPYREEPLVAWLARRLKRPVKWISTRQEDLLTTQHSRGAASTGALALDAGGRIRGLRAHIEAPLGAYLSFSASVNPRNHARCLPGAYAIRDVDIRVTGAITTTPPVGAYRGAGRPEAAFLIERLVEEGARALGIDPAELRRRNLIPREAFPYATATGQVYDSGDYGLALEQALAAADYAGLRRAQAERRRRGELVGIGLSTYVEPAALGWESGVVRVERTGAVTAITGSSPHGQGHETTFAQVVADHLGVDPEMVTVRHGDTLGAPQGGGTAGSRSTALGGGALVLASRDVRDKGRRIAASILEAAAEDVVAVPGGFHVAGTPDRTVSWRAVADVAYRMNALPPGIEPGLESTRFFEAEREVWSSGAFVVAVRVERETGVIVPERIVWVDDAGTIVNPLLADGQLEGSLAQAWGQIAMEAITFDAEGHLLTGTLMDYAIPRADEVPAAEIHHAVTPSPLNPLGAKGLGEAGNIGLPPAVVNAVVDALAPLGVRELDMPLTPARVWERMQRR